MANTKNSTAEATAQTNAYTRKYAFKLIDWNYNGTSTVIIKSRQSMLLSFTGKDGNKIEGTLDSIVYLLKAGIIEGFAVGNAGEGEDGKIYVDITLTGFDPSIELESKSGKKFRWFKECYEKQQFLQKHGNVVADDVVDEV